MEDISNLIKEARPLYFTKKKRREQIKKVMLVAFIFLSTTMGALGGYTAKEVQIANQNIIETNISTIENMDEDSSFYPVDEYGLIAVNF